LGFGSRLEEWRYFHRHFKNRVRENVGHEDTEEILNSGTRDPN